MHEYLHKYFVNIKKLEKKIHTQHEAPEHTWAPQAGEYGGSSSGSEGMCFWRTCSEQRYQYYSLERNVDTDIAAVSYAVVRLQ